MYGFDCFLLLVCQVQPLVCIALLFMISRSRLARGLGGVRHRQARHRLRGARFFECAAYPRLTGWLRYNIQGLALCGLFLLYDVDLVFFFAEVTGLEAWTWGQVGLVGLYVGFFIAGVWYDLYRYGLLWTY